MSPNQELTDAVESDRTLPNTDRVYVVSNSIVAKLYWDLSNAEKELDMGNYVRGGGIAVPEMYEIVPYHSQHLSYHAGQNATYYFLLMERINGISYGELDYDQQREAKFAYRDEIEKLMELGVFPFDSSLSRNTLYETDGAIRARLVDLEGWRKESSEMVRECQKYLSSLRPNFIF